MSTAAIPVPASPARPLKRHTALPVLVDREKRRQHRRRIKWIAFACALVVSIVAVWIAFRPRPVELPERFRSEAVTVGDLTREVRATGHVEAVSTVSVGAEISGRIASVEVDYNDRVTKGQVMASFDRTTLEAQQAQILATTKAAQAAVMQARTDLAESQHARKRAEHLFASNALSEQEHESAVTAALLAEGRLAAAQAQLAAQRAAYAQARTNLDRSVIRAPIDGVVITRNVDPGQTVASVFQTPVLFTVAADLKKMRVIGAVDEADIGELAVGQRAAFSVNAYQDRIFEGVVTEVRNSPVVVQEVVTYGAVVEVANPDLALKPGMTASLRITTATAHDVPRVANAALRFTPPREPRDEKQPAVWILEGGELRRVSVRTGISDGESTALEPGALPAGARALVELTPRGKKAYGIDQPQ